MRIAGKAYDLVYSLIALDVDNQQGLKQPCEQSGNAPAHQLFDKLELRLRDGVATPCRYADYVVTLNRDMPEGVTLTPLVEG